MKSRALVLRGSRASHPARIVLTFGATLATALVIATAVAVMLAIAIATLHGILESPPVRRARARRGARVARHERREKNEARLEQADAAVQSYSDLEEVADGVAEVDEQAAADLEPLLDTFVEVSLARSRCRSALEQGDLARLELQLAIATECRPREAEVLERRVAQTRRFTERLNRYDDSLAALGELVRYYAERASLPEIAPVLDNNAIDLALAGDEA